VEDFFASPVVFAVICGAFGLCIGSFLNVVIYRLPVILNRQWRATARDYLELKEETLEPFSLSKPDSRCPVCEHKIRWYENIPVFSYLSLGGKCSGCSSKISLRYPLIELTAAALAVLPVVVIGPGYPAIAAALFALTLLTLTMIDFDTQLLPDDITLPLMWAGILIATQGWFVSLQASVIGAVVGYMTLWSIYQGFKLATGKEGMGYGDFKLTAALGAWCGPLALPEIMLLSSLLGLAGVGIQRALGKAEAGDQFAFGPWLAIAGAISFFSQQSLTHGYLGW
jgi:leader peptidase (prepilin peptidase)/N-methyltransferase